MKIYLCYRSSCDKPYVDKDKYGEWIWKHELLDVHLSEEGAKSWVDYMNRSHHERFPHISRHIYTYKEKDFADEIWFDEHGIQKLPAWMD